MRVAAYQAPYLPFGSFDSVALIRDRIDEAESAGVEILCCPEGILGGLALESSGQSPGDVALGVHNGELADVIAPLLATPVTTIVGFTERDPAGALFNSAAILSGGRISAVYRKVYPGYRTQIQAGQRLPVYHHGSASYGVIICNDIWYLEPARVLAVAGAAVLFVPTNSGHLTAPAPGLRSRGHSLPIARAVENELTVVVADVAGRQGDRFGLGQSAIVDPDGAVLARAEPEQVGLVVADVQPRRRHHRDPRGWDGHTNPSVADAFVRLWTDAGPSS